MHLLYCNRWMCDQTGGFQSDNGALQRTNIENSRQIFPEKELRGHNPNFHIYVSVGIYIFSPSICLSCCRKYVDRSREYLNRSQTHECGNWNWGRAIPRKGINKCNFRCSVDRFIMEAWWKGIHTGIWTSIETDGPTRSVWTIILRQVDW